VLHDDAAFLEIVLLDIPPIFKAYPLSTWDAEVTNPSAGNAAFFSHPRIQLQRIHRLFLGKEEQIN